MIAFVAEHRKDWVGCIVLPLDKKTFASISADPTMYQGSDVKLVGKRQPLKVGNDWSLSQCKVMDENYVVVPWD